MYCRYCGPKVEKEVDLKSYLIEFRLKNLSRVWNKRERVGHSKNRPRYTMCCRRSEPKDYQQALRSYVSIN